MRFGLVVSEVGANLRRNGTMTAAAVLTITIATALLGGALMVRAGAQKLQYEVLNRIEVSVYLDPICGTPTATSSCLTPSEQTNIEATLKGLPQVKSVTYLNTAEAYKRFRQYFADEPNLIASTPKNILPSSFEVQLRNPQQFEVINSAVGTAPGVSSVSNADSDLKTLFRFFHKIELGVYFLAVFLLAVSLLLIYNTMMVAAFSRRRETGIMRLVGATNAFIQAPFVLEGLVIGAIGTVLSVGILALVRWFISSATSSSAILRPFGTVGTYAHALPLVIVVGLLLPALASLITLRRYLRV